MRIEAGVEYTLVPTILLRLRKMIVIGPTEFSRGEDVLAGAPDASWYEATALLPPFSMTKSRFPPETTALASPSRAEDRRSATSPPPKSSFLRKIAMVHNLVFGSVRTAMWRSAYS